MNLVFLGPPGAGKGTQAKRVAEAKQLVHLATGDLLRAAIKDATPLGLEAKGYMDRGSLVPDELVLRIVDATLAALPVSQGVLFDGFPRTVAQAEGLAAMLAARGRKIDRVVFFDIHDAHLIRRATGRRTCAVCGRPYHLEFQPPRVAGRCDVDGGELVQRSDDSAETMTRRIGAYQGDTAKLLPYYESRGLLARIDAAAQIDDVARALAGLVRGGDG